MSEGATRRHAIAVRIVRETPAAYLVNDGSIQVWMPKSQCEMYARSDGNHDMTADVWILRDKGLI